MIPIQSMDDDMLKLMGRRNTAKEARNILSMISTYRPDIFIETIFLVCYPTAVMTKEEKYALKLYYYENMISLIERQRKELLSHPVEGTLIYKDAGKDYYSTLYRFITNELL